MWKIEYRWLPARSPCLSALDCVCGLGEAVEERDKLDIHMNGATVTLFFPAREPATKCIDRNDGSMEWWGRDSLYVGLLRRDWTRGRVEIRVSM